MRKLLNNLYITSPDAYLSKDGENVVARTADGESFRIPIHNIENILCFTHTGASPALMGHCAENGIGLAFYTPNGRFLARVSGPVSGNVLLRRTQYRWADDLNQSRILASQFVLGKVANSRVVLQRAIREYQEDGDWSEVKKASDYLKNRYGPIENAKDLDILRGVEGESARTYFSVFDRLIRNQKEDFYFSERNRRPPMDRVNSLLSMLYSLLRHEMQSVLESVGLDPAVGFLHRDRPGRPSLALDMMEELRPVLADRLVLSLINRKQIQPQGFHMKENGSVLLEPETRKEILVAWQKRKQEEVVHPYLGEKIPIGLIPYTQALLLARFMRGDIDGYPPFFWK